MRENESHNLCPAESAPLCLSCKKHIQIHRTIDSTVQEKAFRYALKELKYRIERKCVSRSQNGLTVSKKSTCIWWVMWLHMSMSLTSTIITSYQLIQQHDTWTGQRGTGQDKHARSERTWCFVGELLGLNVFLQQMVCWRTGQRDCGRLAVSVWQTRARRERDIQRQTKEDKKGGHQVSKQFYRERTGYRREKVMKETNQSWEWLYNTYTEKKKNTEWKFHSVCF